MLLLHLESSFPFKYQVNIHVQFLFIFKDPFPLKKKVLSPYVMYLRKRCGLKSPSSFIFWQVVFSQPLTYSLLWFPQLQSPGIAIFFFLLLLCSEMWTGMSVIFLFLLSPQALNFQHQLSPMCRNWKLVHRPEAVFQPISWTLITGIALHTSCLPFRSQTAPLPQPPSLQMCFFCVLRTLCAGQLYHQVMIYKTYMENFGNLCDADWINSSCRIKTRHALGEAGDRPFDRSVHFPTVPSPPLSTHKLKGRNHTVTS